MGTKLDCKQYHEDVLNKVRKLIQATQTQEESKESKKIPKPSLLIAYVGNDPASQAYMRGKIKDCESVGITVKQLEFKEDTTHKVASALKLETMFNQYHGVIFQLPVPEGYKADEILQSIKPNQDVDGLVDGTSFKPCTALGIVRLLKHSGIDIEGKHVVILGRSNLVGKPLMNLMVEQGATVTSCNSKTVDIKKYTTDADILVSATGKMHMITPNHIKAGAILIDVGITRGTDGKLHGDIHPDCYSKSSYYTTVPGGIGLVTRATLIENVIDSWNYSKYLI